MLVNRHAAILIGTLCALPAHAQDGQAVDHLDMFLSRWSAGPNISPADVQELYAPRVNYYGHTLDRAGVLREKQAVARKWPQRDYRIVPSSVRFDCEADRSRCHVSGVITWQVGSSSGRRGSGSSTLDLELVRSGAAYQIYAEHGTNLRKAAARQSADSR